MKFGSAIGTLFKTFGRIAFYRMIRSVIKSITDAFKTGVTDIYEYSKAVGTSLAPALDATAGASLTFKNSIGAALAPLLETFLPAIQKICSWLTVFNNKLAEIFAALKGRDTFTAAVETTAKWGDEANKTTGAVKELKKTLLGFDELNVLNDPNSGSGGSGGKAKLDYSSMFEEREVGAKIAGTVESLKMTVEDVFFDWSNLTPEQIVEKVVVGAGAILGGATGFMLGGPLGAVVGTLAGVAISTIFASAIFDHDGKLSKDEVARLIKPAISGLVGGVIGFAIGGPGGALLGASIGVGVGMLLETLSPSEAGITLSDNEVANMLIPALITLVGGVIGFVVGGPGGALIGASVGIGITLLLDALDINIGKNASDKYHNLLDGLFPESEVSEVETESGKLFYNIGKNAGDSLREGLYSTNDDVKTSGKGLLSNMISGMSEKAKDMAKPIKSGYDDKIVPFVTGRYGTFKSAGGTWMTKFGDGASTNKSAISNAFWGAYELMKTPVNSIAKGIQTVANDTIGGVNTMAGRINSINVTIPGFFGARPQL